MSDVSAETADSGETNSEQQASEANEQSGADIKDVLYPENREAADTESSESADNTETQEQPEQQGDSESEQKDNESEQEENEGEGDQQEDPLSEITIPEDTPADEQTLDKFREIVKDKQLDSETTQKLVDLQSEMARQQQQARQDMIQNWVDQTKQDEIVGGNNYQENVQVATKAIEKFGDDDLKNVLNESGLGNHPAIVRAFYRAGKAVSEDTPVHGAPAQSGQERQKSAQEILYGNQ